MLELIDGGLVSPDKNADLADNIKRALLKGQHTRDTLKTKIKIASN